MSDQMASMVVIGLVICAIAGLGLVAASRLIFTKMPDRTRAILSLVGFAIAASAGVAIYVVARVEVAHFAK